SALTENLDRSGRADDGESRAPRVSLSSRAVAILRGLANVSTGPFVFPGQSRNKPLSNMAMDMMLRRMKQTATTVYGFRSSFRDWAFWRPSTAVPFRVLKPRLDGPWG